jgi:hypothetical protein
MSKHKLAPLTLLPCALACQAKSPSFHKMLINSSQDYKDMESRCDSAEDCSHVCARFLSKLFQCQQQQHIGRTPTSSSQGLGFKSSCCWNSGTDKIMKNVLKQRSKTRQGIPRLDLSKFSSSFERK